MSTVDLDAIAREWLNQCGPCDYGMPEYGCTHPQGDYRPVIAALVAEVERLRAILGDDDPRHIIEFRATGWTIGHPLSCRSDLFACEVNRAAERDLVEAPEVLGRFYCDVRDGRFVVTDIAARPTAEDGTRDG